MTAPTEHRISLQRASEQVGAIVAAVSGPQWQSSTPCPGWDVRALLNHLVAGQEIFAAKLTDQPAGSWADDYLGTEPLAAYWSSTARLLAGFAVENALTKVIEVPFGSVPGEVAVHLRLTELLVHGWDLATALRRTTGTLPSDLAEQELSFCERTLPDVPADHSPFGPPTSTPAQAPAIDRLAALLGRTVGGSERE